ncbi:hypothetical protein EGW08_009909 [Elysia chlorotica]|uniref:Uncharacterized protein n=1 Tax=Elysia chlorotica TaxID=188477 RepID=A0A3S0ZM85_ELYCH|nr:hypothetical protein EGW08_009909 [Elysia chlorotica]
MRKAESSIPPLLANASKRFEVDKGACCSDAGDALGLILGRDSAARVTFGLTGQSALWGFSPWGLAVELTLRCLSGLCPNTGTLGVERSFPTRLASPATPLNALLIPETLSFATFSSTSLTTKHGLGSSAVNRRTKAMCGRMGGSPQSPGSNLHPYGTHLTENNVSTSGGQSITCHDIHGRESWPDVYFLLARPEHGARE